MTRARGRRMSELRPVEMQVGAAPYAEGSCLISFGDTRVLCTASVEETVPSWKQVEGGGWVTAEYAMLPRATHTRNSRERAGVKGRTQEIQRIIGRALRAVIDLDALGERTVVIDCDVLQADGGTRTASVTGGYIAFALACRKLQSDGRLKRSPLLGSVAAVSVGLLDSVPVLDLDYSEDLGAQVDMNVVATDRGDLVEVQGTAEGEPFSRHSLDALLDLAQEGIAELVAMQRDVLGVGME